jgi:hypothetical protein
MATAEILARLKLNAQNFTPELGKVLGDAERKFSATGSVIGRNISEGMGAGLQNVAGQIPVVGGALQGLSGPALVAGASIGAIVAVLGKGVTEAEAMATEVRKLDAAIEATGNRTGFLRAELLGLADDLEGKFAIDATEIIKAEAQLMTFRNVAGDTFKQVLELSQDMAVLWGGDLASNANKLGQALQNLGNGDVEGLSKGMKGLGTETLDTIKALAEMGRTADAQAALLAALEERVGGAGEQAATGVSAAMFRLADAIGDATRALVEQTGIYDATARGLDSLAAKIGGVTEALQDASAVEIAQGSALAVLIGMGPQGISGLLPTLGTRTALQRSRDEAAAAAANDNRPPARPSTREERDAVLGRIFRPGWFGEMAIEQGWKLEAPDKGKAGKAEQRTPKETYNAFKAALQAEGLVPTSGFRTFEQQAALYRRLGPGNAARPGTSDHETWNAFDFGANVDRVRLARAAARAGVTLGPELVHGRDRHLHQTFTDGRGKAGGGEADLAERQAKAAKDAADAAEKAARAREQAEERVTDALGDQREELELQLRLGELRKQGLDDQAEVEEAIARLREQILPLIEEQAKLDKAGADAAREQLAVLEQMTVQRIEQKQAAEAQAERDRELAEYSEKASRAVSEALEEQQREQRAQIEDLADFYERAFRSGGKSILQDFEDQALAMIANIAAQWTIAAISGQKASLPDILGQISGQGGGGPLDSLFALFGGRGSGGGTFGTPGLGGGAAGAQGGVPGGFGFPGAPTAAGSGAMGGLGQAGAALGQAVPYVAAGMAAVSAVSSILGIKNNAGGLFGVGGNLLINAISPARRGSAIFTNSGGELGFRGYGNSSSRKEAAGGLAGGINEQLARIAEALGGDVSGTPSTSIGIRDGNFRVDTLGRGWTKKSRAGVLDFGKDEAAAVRAAMMDLLRDGVIGGITATQQRLLTSTKDLDAAIRKAVMVGEIPKRLAAIVDPVGAALDEFNKGWKETLDALKEGGASAEEMADAHKLYKLELDEVKASTRGAAASLKDFLEGLKFGSGSPYSLRDQQAAAEAAIAPLLDKINTGGALTGAEQASYLEKAQALLDIERQLGGSTSAFFDKLDMIQAATNKAIGTIDAAVPIRTIADPFIEATAANTGKTNQLIDQLTDRVNELPGAIAAALGSLGRFTGGEFVGGARGFYERQAV